MTLDGADSPPTIGAFVRLLDELGVSHVVGLPDNGSAALFTRLAAGGGPRLLTATREGEAIAIACGLWIGGAAPLVVIQNTGLLESGDSLRGTALRMGVPLPLLVGFRGAASLDRRADAGDAASLRWPEVDSVAQLTEPTLRAWRIPWEMLAGDADLPRVAAVWRRARDEERPTAVLQTRGFAGC